MKRIITSALVIMLTIGAAQAQSTTDKKPGGHKKEQNKAFDDLNLSADQKARLQSIREDFKKQSEELKNNTSLSAEEKKARRKTLHEQFKTQSESVLTPAQKEQLQKKKAEWKEKNKSAKKEWKRDGKNGTAKGFARGRDMQKELGLTDEQKQKMEQLRNDFRNRFSSLRSDNALTQEQKKAKMQELMKQQHEQMKSILTPEQIQKMKSLRKEHSKKDSK